MISQLDNVLLKKQRIMDVIGKMYGEKTNKIFGRCSKTKSVLAVSGGPDSMALLHMYVSFVRKHAGIDPIVVTVDHKLRKEARDEAEYVGKICKNLNVDHVILTWDGEKPSHGIQEAARKARYDLIFEFMKSKKSDHLMLAHHADDEFENFFIRLGRGSGAAGLSSMGETSMRNGFVLVRPLLDKTKQELIEYLKNNNHQWFTDPSNDNEHYLRVKIRKMKSFFEEMGLTTNRVRLAMKNLHRVSSYLSEETTKAIVTLTNRNNEIVSMNLCEYKKLHEEIRLRVLSSILMDVGKTNYCPRLEKLERLDQQIKDESFKKTTLNNVVIEKKESMIKLSKENRNKN